MGLGNPRAQAPLLAIVLGLIAVALAGGVASGCGGGEDEATSEPPPTTTTETAPGDGEAASGAQLFRDNCESCHGVEGAGGHVGPNLQTSPVAENLAQVKARTRGGLCVLGLRFSADRGCPAERFATLGRELGDGFEAVEVDSSPGNPYDIPGRAHAVLTVDLVDAPGHPTRVALDRVLGFLDQRLHP